jgi:hypothetical protein
MLYKISLLALLTFAIAQNEFGYYCLKNGRYDQGQTRGCCHDLPFALNCQVYPFHCLPHDKQAMVNFCKGQGGGDYGVNQVYITKGGCVFGGGWYPRKKS